LGVFVGVASIFLIKEPKRGAFDFKDQFKNSCDESDEEIVKPVEAVKTNPF